MGLMKILAERLGRKAVPAFPREAVEQAKTISFSLFNRFGDGVIAAVAAAEFMAAWKGKRFIVFTSPQLAPYVEVLCPLAEVVAFRKKHLNDWRRLLVRTGLRGLWHIDVGFNPYSFSSESRVLASLAKTTWIYRSRPGDFFVNYYDRVRQYFGLPVKGDFAAELALPAHPKSIVVCPESSEIRRSLGPARLENLLNALRRKWPQAEIVIADSQGPAAGGSVYRHFVFGKNRSASLAFIDLVKSADLVVSVDSGPLHVATALGRPVLAIFSSAMPQTVLDAGAKAACWRQERLADVYCEVISCADPTCLDGFSLEGLSVTPGGCERRVESHACPCRCKEHAVAKELACM